MTRKRLPKVITRETEKSDDVKAGVKSKTLTERQARKLRPKGEDSGQRSAAPEPAAEPHSAPASSSLIERQRLPQATIFIKRQTVRRRAVGLQIVERYKLYAALGGLSPLPIINVASVMAVNLQMVKTLCTLYEVPFERDRARSMIAGFMAGVVPTGLGAVTASTLALAVPGVGFVGVAVSSLTAAALTTRIGSLFVDRFESVATPSANSETAVGPGRALGDQTSMQT